MVWNETNIRYLEENYSKIRPLELTNILNKSISSIYSKANRLNLKIPKILHIERMRSGMIGKKHLNVKGHVPWNKNRKGIFKEESLEIMRQKRKKWMEEHPKHKPQLGIKHSKKTKKKISLSLKKIYLDPKNHPAWRGGIARLPYPYEFNNKLKIKIKERDDWTCQECGFKDIYKNRKLHIHHIDYNKNNNKLSNLISLCDSCHGKTCFRKIEWILYYRRKINVK